MADASQEPDSIGGDDDDGEELFDAFLEAALEGAANTPEQFLDSRGITDPEQRARWIGQLMAIQRLATPVAQAPDAQSAPPVEDGLEQEELDQHIGEYRLVRKLGAGAMGEVFLAEQSSLGRLVALKTLRAHLALSPTAGARFEREAKALGQINHANVVRIHDFGQDGELLYLAMELLPGRSLKERLETPRPGEAQPTPLEVARWGLQLAGGLEAAHRAGLVHRDVKPGNVRIVEGEKGVDDRAVLVDFGLARLAEPSDLSHTGEFLGSPAYASPEQIRGDADLDERSDVYSLGATLYHALAGVAPFRGGTLEAVLHAVLNRDPEPLQKRNTSLPRDFALVVHKAIEKGPTRRYSNAEEFAEDLRAVLELRPVTAKHRGPLGRALRWTQRNKPAAAGLAIACISLTTAFGYVAESGRKDERRVTSQATQLLADAKLALAEFRETRMALAQEENDFDWLWTRLEYGHLTKEQSLRLRQLDSKVRSARDARDRAFVRGQNLLDSAVRLRPSLGKQARVVRGDLLRERLLEAHAQDDKQSAAFLTTELERFGIQAAESTTAAVIANILFTSKLEGTRAWLFQYLPLEELVPGGEWRLVPIPLSPSNSSEPPIAQTESPPTPWGSEVLRVEKVPISASDGKESAITVGDIISTIDGFAITGGPFVSEIANTSATGIPLGSRLVRMNERTIDSPMELPALLLDQPDLDHAFEFILPGTRSVKTLSVDEFRAAGFAFESIGQRTQRLGGKARVHGLAGTRDLALAPNSSLRPSFAAPLLTRNGEFPLDEGLALPPGSYLLITTAPGAQQTRHALLCNQGESLELDVTPVANVNAPSAFVFCSTPTQSRSTPFWIMEREVTAAEYLIFLNHPETLALVDSELARGVLTRVPKVGLTQKEHAMWPRSENGEFSISTDWLADWPVLGVTYQDALAYCEWRTERDGVGTYSLPTRWQTLLAGSGDTARRFSWGTRYSQHFANTCFSREVARPEPVLSSPRDESPFGVYDTCGNALEWVTDWYDKSRNLRHAIGGSWGQSRLDTLSVEGGIGIADGLCGGETGFRMIWIPLQGDIPEGHK